MRYKLSPLLLLVSLPIILGVRIPPNPCPKIFTYYKDPRGRIYGEVIIPYDNATYMEFAVNASIVGRYKKSDLSLKMITTLDELNNYTPTVVYSVFFPFEDVIPKITAITYNGRLLCSGPAEPVIPGTPGITNVWHKIYYEFTRRHIGFYRPDTNPDKSDNDLPTKNPGDRPQWTQWSQWPETPPIRPPTHATRPPTYETWRPSIQTWTQTIPTKPPTIPTKPPTIPTRPPTIPTKPPTIPTRQQTPPIFETASKTPNEGSFPMRTPDTGPTKFPLDPGPIDIDSLFTPPVPATTAPTATFTSPSVTTNNEFKCGISSKEPPKSQIVPFIFNSQNTDVGEYPWLVAFMVRNPQSQGFDYKCSGNLITDKHVITAARCVQYFNVQIVASDDILLIMGTNSLISWQSNGAVSRKVRNVESHPFFKENSRSAHGDLAVLTMERPVQFSKVLAPVCLWKGNTDLDPFTNRMGVIAGFGQDEEAARNGRLHSVRLKRANMPIVSQIECLTSPVGFNDLATEKTFCTKSTEILTGPCIGDSGAGFFIKLDGAYYLRGIASAISTNNGTCDLSHKYSVFCDVAKFRDWIKTAMD